MNLQEFKKTIEDDLSSFEQFWKDEGEKEPKNFPEELKEGDWFEQFLMFISSKR